MFDPLSAVATFSGFAFIVGFVLGAWTSKPKEVVCEEDVQQTSADWWNRGDKPYGDPV